ncbi:hypothetical protein AQ616_10240 [Oceanobacillus sp. E9]|uniref:Uncharacterized protein n=1 Tax=Oceanobacillus kimchii TaxID=746691 RepID=A0ABQ5TIC0_9BACI|nr:hypothetical protein AQ616_10240 [Oceanobacillus sp. E9]GLO65429.1 hypothetical protein MACH08_12130 [Oceanobacillus kimchii]
MISTHKIIGIIRDNKVSIYNMQQKKNVGHKGLTISSVFYLVRYLLLFRIYTLLTTVIASIKDNTRT